jgi:type I restriction enzyme S subunit
MQMLEKYFDTAFDAPDGIKKLRELILTLAMQGKLVPQDPNDQPASELLKEIGKEKDQLIKEKKIKKIAIQSEIKIEKIDFQIPKSWEWVKFGNIAHQITDGAHHTPTYINEGVPFLSVKDMSSGVLDFSNTRYISLEQHKDLAKRCNPQNGDLLLTKVGTTGITGLSIKSL